MCKPLGAYRCKWKAGEPELVGDGNPGALAWVNQFGGAHVLQISYLLRKQAWHFQCPALRPSPQI